MVNFDELNRRTHDFNCNNVNPTHRTCDANALFIRRNNETFKKNNGAYPVRSF